MKQEMTSADVAALVSELGNVDVEGSLIDAKIDKIYQPVPGEIRINLFIFGKGRDNLVIQAGKRAHMSKYLRPSPKLPHAFPMLLRKHISAGRITSVNQYDFDRIIEIGVIRGGIETILVCELFSRGNIVLLDSDRKIILPMNPVTFRGRRIRSGEIYEYPEAQLSPLDVEEAGMADLFASSTSDVVRTIATSYNLGGVLAEEVCLRAGVDKKTAAKDATPDDVKALCEAVKVVFSPIVEHRLKPCIVKKKVNGELEAIDVAPLELEQYSADEKEYFPSFNQALDEFFGKKASEEVIEQVVAKKKEKVDVFERRLHKQQEAIKKFEKDSEKYTAIAEKVYEHYQSIEQVLAVLENARNKGYSWAEIRSILKKAKDDLPAARLIISIDSAEGFVVVDLDGINASINIRKTVPQNAQIYYDKAKKLSKKRDGALRAIEDTKVAMQKREKKVSKRRKAFFKKHWYDRFRWFFSSDGFLVVGGRDADTNEELVKKYMEKRDIVFHTQVPGAPITIIKTEGKDVPETTLEEAARFVVSYSSIWKAGQFSGDCYWIKPEQVSKTPESGEYLRKGSFVIRGERNYYKDVPVGVAVGLELGAETRVIGGPVSAIERSGKYVVELLPGKFNQNDIAKKVYRIYVDELKDPSFVKQVASPDSIARMLPPGESDIKK
ncbi:ribosome rescue protein RqcH [Methanococcoides sp. NM1]|uniref:ribosome rescue protein RqcH n=1 Tax=Methanococcoides sp. NM1 TaxID=1201013 RepID=UPI0010839426|nr:ribosome rescue protein RqcH [Methanococcoides sp. NM1]